MGNASQWREYDNIDITDLHEVFSEHPRCGKKVGSPSTTRACHRPAPAKMSSRMRLHRDRASTWSRTYATCFYSAPCAGDLVLRSLSLLSWRRASPSQPEFVVAASVARLGRFLQCCFAVVDPRGTRKAIDADARPEKHGGRVELVRHVVPAASRDEARRPTKAPVHSRRSDGRSGCRRRATQENEFHL